LQDFLLVPSNTWIWSRNQGIGSKGLYHWPTSACRMVVPLIFEKTLFLLTKKKCFMENHVWHFMERCRRWVLNIENRCFLFNTFLIVSTSEWEPMFVTLHSYIKSLKSGLFHSTGQPNYQKGRAKVENGIISETKFLEAISVDWYSQWTFNLLQDFLLVPRNTWIQTLDLRISSQGL
jgi:hypothetical protein